jgi:asparagine synthetase B (glutamine-hydrolysing)
VNAARNLVAVYVEGRSREEIERLGQRLAARSGYRMVGGAPDGWLVAVESTRASHPSHCTEPRLVSIEAPSSGVWPKAAVERALAEPELGLRELTGELAFCAFEPNGVVRAVRSCGGLVPIYYQADRTSVCVATRLRDLFWLCPSEPSLDHLVHAIWSSGNAVFPDERTFLSNTRVLLRGHALLARPGSAKVTRYWEPRPDTLPEPSAETAAEHARELRQIVLDTLERGLDPERTNLLTLSGGVDSSALAVLCRRTLERPLATLTFVAPRKSPARARQLSYVQPLLDELSIESRHLIDAENSVLDRLFAKPLSTLCYCPHPALRLLPELPGSFATLVSGHFADEISGYSQRRQDWVRHTRLASLLRPQWPPAYALRDAMRWTKRRALEAFGRALLPLPHPLGRIYAPDLRAELVEWLSRTRSRLLADERPLRELATWVTLDAWVAMHWEVASVAGVTPVHPFFGRAILELAFRCHPSELFGPGTKKILRRALAGLVPARYLERPDKGHWHRPPRSELGRFEGRLSTLEPCISRDFLSTRRADLSSAERRQWTQLQLFEAALVRERAFRRSLQQGSD